MLKLPLCARTQGLPELLAGGGIGFSRYLNTEKEIKGWMLNGSAVRSASAGGSTVDGLAPTYDDLESLAAGTYIDAAAGSWSEVLSRDLRPAAAFMPATTLYHLVMMVRELAWEREGLEVR